MELVLLDDKFRETGRFSDFESLVWNERFTSEGPGDFQLRSFGIRETTSKVREGTFVSVSNSNVVMQVTNVEKSVESDGSEVVSITGLTLDHIFEHRPAVHTLGSIDFMDGLHPNGWEFGDELTDDYFHLDPLEVIDRVLARVDGETYGRTELSYMSLPFKYYQQDFVMEVPPAGPQPLNLSSNPPWLPPLSSSRPPPVDPEPDDEYYNQIPISRVSVPPHVYNDLSVTQELQYYSVDRGTSVQTVIKDMLEKAEMGMVILRPNTDDPISRHHTQHTQPGEDRQAAAIFYRPRRHDPVNLSFDYKYEDYISSTASVDHNFVSHMFEARSDDVLEISRPQRRGSGMDVRVSLKETEDADMTNVQVNESKIRTLQEFVGEFTSGRTYSLETDGVYPFRDKSYKFGTFNDDEFYLGDALTLNVEGVGEVFAQVVEFIRAMDQDGYREYPTFRIATKIGRWYVSYFNRAKDSMKTHYWN